ncbi:hypothetical protein DFH09DRAFT_1363234 [Mycena vulgaris]|nr:hypothetical protein DFH09DRAFT_1363234 [Mycena vulgaris]
MFETSLPFPMLTDPSVVTLQHLELRAASSHRQASSRESTAKIYSALKRHVPRASFAVLSTTSGPVPHAHAISSDTLRLLFCFTSLTFVVLRPPNGFDIDDNAVQAMAEACPLVEYLSLRSRSGTHPLRTTLRSLLSLATHCRRLTRLEISLDASTVPGVADSLLVSALLVTRFLSGVFPSLTNICTKRQDGRNHPGSTAGALKARWKEVEETLLVCNAMRNEEQYWTQRACHCRYRSEEL